MKLQHIHLFLLALLIVIALAIICGYLLYHILFGRLA